MRTRGCTRTDCHSHVSMQSTGRLHSWGGGQEDGLAGAEGPGAALGHLVGRAGLQDTSRAPADLPCLFAGPGRWDGFSRFPGPVKTDKGLAGDSAQVDGGTRALPSPHHCC